MLQFMKNPVKQTLVNQLILGTVTCLLGLVPSARAGEGHAHGLVLRSTSVASSDNNGPSNQEQKVVIEDLEPSASEGGRREVAWLGLATEESSEAVTSQLGLKTGEGLIVMFVAPDSPAGKAGFQKNDLLLELD